MSNDLIPHDLRTRMLANGARSAAGEDIDPYPVLKLFTPNGAATWLLTELDPHDPDIAFGLCGAQHKPNYAEYGVMWGGGVLAPFANGKQGQLSLHN